MPLTCKFQAQRSYVIPIPMYNVARHGVAAAAAKLGQTVFHVRKINVWCHDTCSNFILSMTRRRLVFRLQYFQCDQIGAIYCINSQIYPTKRHQSGLLSEYCFCQQHGREENSDTCSLLGSQFFYRANFAPRRKRPRLSFFFVQKKTLLLSSDR